MNLAKLVKTVLDLRADLERNFRRVPEHVCIILSPADYEACKAEAMLRMTYIQPEFVRRALKHWHIYGVRIIKDPEVDNG